MPKKDKKPLPLTTDNYYSDEANRDYLSCSQFEDFLACEAAAAAKYEGRYRPKDSKAFAVGKYFHSFFESPEAFTQYITENESTIYQKNGKKRADYIQADQMLEAAQEDSFIRRLIDLPGENEKIMTGKLFGRYPWKIRLDKYVPDNPRLIIDWKTVGSINERMWSDEDHSRVNFVEAFRYLFRAAVYIEIEKQFTGKETDPAFWLVCISKEDPPDKAVIALNGTSRQRFDIELEKVKEKIWRIQEIKDGRILPKRCGKCAYCRATKTVDHVMHYWELDPENAPELETEGEYNVVTDK